MFSPEMNYNPIYNQYSESYQQACYNKSIGELSKMTWEAQTGEVVIGMLLFKIEALEKDITDLKEKLNDSNNSQY